jgi:beta-mannosidase
MRSDEVHSQTAGVLVWQLNDSWPVVSWSLVDYFLRPKPSYYTIARELAPISVGILRTVEKNRDCDRPDQFYEFGAFTSVSATIEVWGTNSRLEEKKVSCELTCFHLESEWTHVEKHEVTLLPNQSTEILKIPCPHPKPGSDPLSTPSYSVIVSARLLDLTDGAVIARYVDWPQPFKFTDFPDPKLDIKVDGEDVIIEAKYPVKGLVLSVDEAGEEVKWSDNALDLVPGDVQKVRAKGLKGRKIKVAHLGEEKSC